MRLHFFAWESQETATICEGDYKQLGPAVYHSTGFFKDTTVTKEKAARPSMSISWKHEYRTSCFQSHNESQKSSQHATGGGGCVHFLE